MPAQRPAVANDPGDLNARRLLLLPESGKDPIQLESSITWPHCAIQASRSCNRMRVSSSTTARAAAPRLKPKLGDCWCSAATGLCHVRRSRHRIRGTLRQDRAAPPMSPARWRRCEAGGLPKFQAPWDGTRWICGDSSTRFLRSS